MSVHEIQHDSQTVPGPAGALFVRSWRPPGQAVASIVVAHGFKSHSRYYQWTGENLAAQGYSTFALDLRGRGNSEGQRYFVQTMSDYARDVNVGVELAKSREPHLPVFLLGAQYGLCCVVCFCTRSSIANQWARL